MMVGKRLHVHKIEPLSVHSPVSDILAIFFATFEEANNFVVNVELQKSLDPEGY